jgi:uncharacterized protein HemY
VSRFIRLTIWLGILGALLGLGLYLGDRVKADPGYVLFAYGGYTIEMSLWAFLVCLIAITVVLWVLFGLGGALGRLPLNLLRAWGRMRHRKADSRLVEGAFWLRRDEPARALSVLKKDASSESLPALHWLLASEAARRLEHLDESERYLESAERLMASIPKVIEHDPMPTEFKPLLKSLKKKWREDWALDLETVGDDDALLRLASLTSLAKVHTDSVALEVVQARLALNSGLEAEARHYIERASQLDPSNPLVLLLRVESETGRTAALEDLRHRLLQEQS